MFQIYRKIDQILIKAFFITVVICFSGYCGVKEAYTYLKQNQKVIINALSQCHPPNSPLFKFPCNFDAMDNMKTLLEKSSINDSIIELTVREFLSDIGQISSLLNRRRTGIISDSLSITFLSELISSSFRTNEKECGLANAAAREITRHVSYPSLNKYKNQIDVAVMNSCLEPHLKRDIHILTGPNESEKQAFLKELQGRNHPEYTQVKARLGDSIAIEKLNTEYQNSEYFDEKKMAIRQIFVSGQIELIKMVIADFNNPMYDVYTNPPCTSSSTQFETLQGLRRWHPEEKLINEDFLEMVFNFGASPKQVRQYLESVTKWLERKYAIKIENKSKAYTFGRICVR